MTTHKIENLLSEGHNRVTPLQRLLKSASNQKQWTAELRALLDAKMRYEVQVTDIRGHVAHLACASGAAATRLRFILPDILDSLQQLQSYSQVTEFKIHVATVR